MPSLPGHGGMIVGANAGNLSAYGALVSLGLTANLQCCLDVGDAASYTSGQTWFDETANAANFYLGTSGSVSGSDPTFNGTPGNLSSNEYWSFNGSQFFTLAQTNPAWVNNMHKAGQTQAILAWVYIPTLLQVGCVLGDRGASSPGFSFAFGNANNTLDWGLENGSTNDATFSTMGVGAIGWHLLGVSITNTNGSTTTWQIDGTSETDTNSQSITPSSGSAPATLTIGKHASYSNGSSFVPSGTRLGSLAIIQGSGLTGTQMTAYFNATRGRYGV